MIYLVSFYCKSISQILIIVKEIIVKQQLTYLCNYYIIKNIINMILRNQTNKSKKITSFKKYHNFILNLVYFLPNFII